MNHFLDYRQEALLTQRATYGQAAETRPQMLHKRRYYYKCLRKLLESVVEQDKRVLCIRSDVGQFLEWVKPSRGVGVEIAPELIEVSRKRYPQFEFHQAFPEDCRIDGEFDYILLINAINDLFDVQETLENLRAACDAHTRVVIIWHNFFWQPLLNLAERIGLKRHQPTQNWLSFVHMAHLLHLAGYEIVREYREVLCPCNWPPASWLANSILARLPLLDKLCLVQGVIARPLSDRRNRPESSSISVIVPCRNERGNVEAAARRIPEMGAHTEIIFCDDHSTDGTGDEVRRIQAKFPARDIKLVEGPGICKARNVWTGFDAARGDILVILDGDLTVPPEELPKFYQALVDGRGEFINGTRMVYPMRDESMRLANIFGNKMFSLAFTHILRQRVTDTLCGTKALWRRDYERMRPLRGTWGINDRWGDYELIFGAAKLGLRHLDVPVHYMERTYGRTKMTGRLSNAWVMLRMCLAAYRRFR